MQSYNALFIASIPLIISSSSLRLMLRTAAFCVAVQSAGKYVGQSTAVRYPSPHHPPDQHTAAVAYHRQQRQHERCSLWCRRWSRRDHDHQLQHELSRSCSRCHHHRVWMRMVVCRPSRAPSHTPGQAVHACRSPCHCCGVISTAVVIVLGSAIARRGSDGCCSSVRV